MASVQTDDADWIYINFKESCGQSFPLMNIDSSSVTTSMGVLVFLGHYHVILDILMSFSDLFYWFYTSIVEIRSDTSDMSVWTGLCLDSQDI